MWKASVRKDLKSMKHQLTDPPTGKTNDKNRIKYLKTTIQRPQKASGSTNWRHVYMMTKTARMYGQRLKVSLQNAVLRQETAASASQGSREQDPGMGKSWKFKGEIVEVGEVKKE